MFGCEEREITDAYGSDAWHPHSDDGRYSYITHSSDYGDIAQLWVLVHSSEARKRAIKTLSRRYEKQSIKEQHAINALAKERFACEADAHKALSKLHKSLTLTQIKSSIESIERYKGKGRPAKAAQPDYLEYCIACTPISSSLEAYQRELHGKSCFILATNDTTKTAQSLIDAYKNQYVVERGFAFLKSKEFFADALYLKSPERIEALLMIMALSLMVYTALEYRIRHELKAHHATFNDQKGKPTATPTARWVFQCFEGIQLLRLHDTNQTLMLNLNNQHRLIISLLGRVYEKIYGLGSGV
jgi:transposase